MEIFTIMITHLLVFFTSIGMYGSLKFKLYYTIGRVLVGYLDTWKDECEEERRKQKIKFTRMSVGWLALVSHMDGVTQDFVFV